MDSAMGHIYAFPDSYVHVDSPVSNWCRRPPLYYLFTSVGGRQYMREFDILCRFNVLLSSPLHQLKRKMGDRLKNNPKALSENHVYS
mmetsp:Transcript_21424/g.32531  ORF Transcript_21424/g.32531 Transcript_21424/m.32531 type:complete len:87 (+) Transcript_21424:410-670(+)